MMTTSKPAMQTILQIILFILVVVVILKFFFETEIYQELLGKTITQKIKNTNPVDIELTSARITAQQKINRAIEESFANQNTTNSIGENIVSYINRSNKVKLELYYKPSCPHCSKFMPIWTKIINDLPNDATYEEINCETNPAKANENKITSVPTIILLVNNEKKVYMGNRTYEDISRFLKVNGVNLIKRTFEDFDSINQPSQPPTNPNCPAVSFDKQIDLANDTYMYQIFNTQGQYGYASGGYNADKLLTPFQAAYSTVDSYLSSLPDTKDPTKNSFANINECASLYSSQIVNFGLCDLEQLNNIAGYQSNVSSGISSTYIDGTDYSKNPLVINAIKQVCGFNE